MQIEGIPLIYIKEDSLRDIGTSFWLRDAIEHLDKLSSRDCVDAVNDLEWLYDYIGTMLSERR